MMTKKKLCGAIALTTGEIPPAAKFYLGREELKDGNVLEIEFKTE